MQTQFANLNNSECVYNLIPRPCISPCKPNLYVSRYHNLVRKQAQCAKQGCSKTLGPPYVPLCPPEGYLRKHSRMPISIRPPGIPQAQLCPVEVQVGPPVPQVQIINELPSNELQDDCVCAPECATGSIVAAVDVRKIPRLCCNINKPRVPPACCSKFELIPKGCKDFIKENAVKSVRAPAKIPQARYVDHSKGDSHEWTESGFAKKYIHRMDYGKVPGYIQERKAEVQQKLEHERCIKEQQKREMQEKCRHMTEDERTTLLHGLKSHWEKLFCDYQTLPLVQETPKIIAKKIELEEHLAAIEKDIQLLERHNHIFVGDAPRSFYMADD